MLDPLLSALIQHPIAFKLSRKTFHPFPRLPAELRVKIWFYALQNEIATRRTVNISKSKSKYRVVLSQPYPALFSVTRESRYEACRILDGDWVILKAGKLRVFIAFERDTVLLRGCTELFDVGEKKATWMGRRVEMWLYGRNLESREPMYVVCREDGRESVDEGKLFFC